MTESLAPQGSDRTASIGEWVLLAGGLAGLGLAGWRQSGLLHEILHHEVHPIGGSLLPAVLLMGGFVLLWGHAWYRWRVPVARMARSAWPLAGLLGLHLALLAGGVQVGMWSLHALTAACGLNCFLLVRQVPGEHDWRLSPRLAWMVIGGTALLYCLWSFWYQQYMYERLFLGFSDIGYWYRRLHNTMVHGDFLVLWSDKARWWDHFCPGLAVLLPFFALVPRMETVMAAQALMLGGTGVLLFWLARREQAPAHRALLLGLIWFVYPGVSQASFGYSLGFHTNTLALPFVVLSCYAVDTRRYRWLWVTLPMVALMKEYMLLYLLGMWISLALSRRWRPGMILLVLSMGYMVGIVTLYMPTLDADGYRQAMTYSALGRNLVEVALSPLLRPTVFWGNLLRPDSWSFLAQMLLPIFLTILLAPRYVVALAPFVVLGLAAGTPGFASIAMHYHVPLMGVLFSGMLASVIRAPHEEFSWPLIGRAVQGMVRRLNRTRREAWLAGALGAGFCASIYLGLYPYSRPTIAMLPGSDACEVLHLAWQDLRRVVPMDATVSADDRCIGALADRRFIARDGFHDRPTNYHAFLEGAWGTKPEDTHRRVAELLATGEFDLIHQEHHLFVLRRKALLPPLPDNVY